MLPRTPVVALLGVLLLSTAHAERLVLASGGAPAATIVVSAGASEREKLAAGDLQHYVQAICGVKLPLRADGRTVSGTGLYVGHCEPSEEADLPPAGGNPEAFAVRLREGNVFLAGRYPTPTYFAVAEFIEKSLGVRWFAPGEEWEYVPAGRAGELAVDLSPTVSSPDTSPRIWSGHAWNDDWQTWSLRNRAVLSEVVPRRQFQNNVYRVFPPARYAATHPEYYPLIDGKRWIPGEGDVYWRPCESNPEVIALVAEYARKWFDTHSEVDSFSVGMDDVSHMCGCPNCRAWDAHPDSYEKHEFSDRHYKFVNALAREIRKTHPDRYIGTLIYAIARELPETVDKLEDNVFGFLTEESASWWQPGVKESDHELTRQWARRCRHLSRYDYFGMGGITPRVYPHTVAEALKFDKALGLEGMYVEVYTFLPNTAPMMWAFARLQWDSRQDVDALLREFYTRMFGPAAGTVEEYFNLLERSWLTARPGRSRRWFHRNLAAQAEAMSAADVAAGFRLLRRARTEATTEAERGRIACLRAALQYGSYPIEARELSAQLLALQVQDRASADQALGLLARMARLARERERCWQAAPRRPDLLGETVRGLGGKDYLMLGQMPMLEAGGTAAAMRLVAWYSEHAREALPEVRASLDGLQNTSIGRVLQGWLWVLANRPTSLVANGGFEQAGANTAVAEADWQTAGAPPAWSTWASGNRGRFALAPGRGVGGGSAASLSGAGSACYLQSIAVKPGESYLAVAWVKPEPAGSDGGGSFALRLRTSDGKWYPQRSVEPSIRPLAGVSGWQPLLLALTIPDGAGQVVLMPGASGQREGMAVLIDDLALYRLPAAATDKE